jgi:hypothetical protein
MDKTKYGTEYTPPVGLNEQEYYGLMYALTDFVTAKGLTLRQAQRLFRDCSDMLLDCYNPKSDDKLSTKDDECEINKDEVIAISKQLEKFTKSFENFCMYGICVK